MTVNVENYLSRISFPDEPQVNIRTLASLHRHHIQCVPFENLDIHYGRKISLEISHIEEKIIANRRGGFCYEQNGLFCELLRQLGFEVKMISARVSGDTEYGPEFDHMVLVVELGEEWLVDVGFGDNFWEPIKLKVGEVQEDPAGFYRIEKHDSNYLRMESSKDKVTFSPQYIFTETEREIEDYEGMCEYHQTSPESHFTRERVCTLATGTGRITLRDNHQIETIDGQKTITEVMNEEEYARILKERFEIEIK